MMLSLIMHYEYVKKVYNSIFPRIRTISRVKKVELLAFENNVKNSLKQLYTACVNQLK